MQKGRHVRVIKMAWWKVGFDVCASCTRVYMVTHLLIIGYGGRRL